MTSSGWFYNLTFDSCHRWFECVCVRWFEKSQVSWSASFGICGEPTLNNLNLATVNFSVSTWRTWKTTAWVLAACAHLINCCLRKKKLKPINPSCRRTIAVTISTKWMVFEEEPTLAGLTSLALLFLSSATLLSVYYIRQFTFVCINLYSFLCVLRILLLMDSLLLHITMRKIIGLLDWPLPLLLYLL